ncbi:salivary gland SP38-40.A protein-like [Chironomus tepperi]|uniref:salivary gland SP38-40.A protein-like n=1 Tax=Chironomus tepperi TaxID=113505 RepID=UPI00391EF934
MRIKFLVVLAVICYFAQHASASGMGKPEKAEPKPIAAKPAPAKPESEEYDVEVIHHKKEKTEKKEKEKKTHVEIKKEVKKKEKKVIPCSEKVKDDKLACETKDVPAGYKGVFTYKDDEDCDWSCDYEALPPAPGAKKDDKKEKKVVKVVKPPKEKKEKKPKKECSGEKVIKFQNCLVKVRGLIAFGDKTRNFDKKFAKLVAGKKKKGAKKAKGGKKGAKAPKGQKPATPAANPK